MPDTLPAPRFQLAFSYGAEHSASGRTQSFAEYRVRDSHTGRLFPHVYIYCSDAAAAVAVANAVAAELTAVSA